MYNFLEKEGYYNIKEIPNKGLCALYRFAFTTGLVIGIHSIGYIGRYCYQLHADAVKAINEWDGVGDPSGNWIKYKGEGGERSNNLLEKESEQKVCTKCGNKKDLKEFYSSSFNNRNDNSCKECISKHKKKKYEEKKREREMFS
jgi:hypothetical protein